MSQNFKKSGRIGVLMGGYSSEREISLKSGQAVFKALKAEGYNVIELDIIEQDLEKIASLIKEARIDLAFITLHGRLGEDGTIQAILEDLEIPYPGSGVEASQRALNKISAQNIFVASKIFVPPYISLTSNQTVDLRSILQQVGEFPLIVKPSCEGSSIGITVVYDKNQLQRGLDLAWDYGYQALVEKFIEGREFTVGILENCALPVIEICPHEIFFDFTSKYQKGMTDYIIPAEISETLALRLRKIALKAHHALGCLDLSRVDFMVDQELNPYVLEVNTIPGFTETSLLPKAAKEIGINFNQLCIKLVELAYGKKKENQDTILCC